MAKKAPSLTDLPPKPANLAAFAAAPSQSVEPVLARRVPGRPRGPRLELLGGRVPPALAAAWRACCTISNREQQAALADLLARGVREMLAALPKDVRPAARYRADAELRSILAHLESRSPLTPEERAEAGAALAVYFEESRT